MREPLNTMDILNYNWNLKDAIFTKDNGKVFSCFACGGGSTTPSSNKVLSQVLQDNLNFFQIGAGVDTKTFMPYDTDPEVLQ